MIKFREDVGRFALPALNEREIRAGVLRLKLFEG